MLRAMDTLPRPTLACLAAACLAVACLALAPAAAGAQTVSLRTGGKSMQIRVGDAAVLPADVPRDVPLPEGGQLVRVQRSGASTLLTYAQPGEPAAIVAALDGRLRADGWRPARVKAPAEGTALAWTNEQRVLIAWAHHGGTDAGAAAAAAAVADASSDVSLQLELIDRGKAAAR